MTLTPVAASSPPAALAAKTATTRSPSINSDFDTFLRMLTTQLQNQDPLNPMDSSEFAVQLATFSGVEQQMKSNELLQELGGQLGVMGLSELAGWVGREARATMPVWFDGSPVTVAAKPDSRATSAELVVRNASGSILAREPIGLSGDSFLWRGTNAQGVPLAEGRYDLSVESLKDGAVIATTPVEAYGTILEARGGPTGTTLVFEGGIEVTATSVTALRGGS